MRLKIRFKELSKGFQTAYFDIHINGERKIESTGIRYKINPSNLLEREERKEKLKLIQMLASKKEMELLTGINHLQSGYDPSLDFVSFIDQFISNHKIQEIKKFYAMRKLFVQFAGKERVSCYEITESFLRKFVIFLEVRLKGESPSNYFAKLKQVLKTAVSEGILLKNPAEGISVKKKQFLQKDVLNYEEIALIAQTPSGNEIVKAAFLFCVFSGLRYCDVSLLKWENILSDKLNLVQKKTKIPLSVPLNEDAQQFLPKIGKPNELVFQLPSHTACQKWVKRLVKDAGIEKKISWHSGRHSFGTNLIKYGVDVSITSKLLGHTSLLNTQRYVRVNEEMKVDAISKLPTITRK